MMYGSPCKDTYKIMDGVRKLLQGHTKQLFVTYGSARQDTTENY